MKCTTLHYVGNDRLNGRHVNREKSANHETNGSRVKNAKSGNHVVEPAAHRIASALALIFGISF